MHKYGIRFRHQSERPTFNRVAQWWEHSPPTNVARVRTPASTPYVGWVCCWFCPLLQEVFLRVLRFSPLLKKQHSQIPIRSGTHEHVSTSSKCSVGKQITIFFYIPNKRCDSIRTDWWNECSRTKKYVLQARRSHENCHKRHDTRNYRDPQPVSYTHLTLPTIYSV